MILIPLDTKGVKINRALTVFGYDDAPIGHMEVDFNDDPIKELKFLMVLMELDKFIQLKQMDHFFI